MPDDEILASMHIELDPTKMPTPDVVAERSIECPCGLFKHSITSATPDGMSWSSSMCCPHCGLWLEVTA